MEGARLSANDGLYLYCVLDAGRTPPGERGIDGRRDAFVLPYRELGALVGEVALADYSDEALSGRFQDPDWVGEHAGRHDAIVRSAMEAGGVLPVRFGTIYSSEQHLKRALAGEYDRLRSFLAVVGDKEEWGLKVYAPAGRNAADEEGGVNELGCGTAAGPGTAYFLRKKRERLRREGGLVGRSTLAGEIFECLAARSARSRRNRLLSRRASGVDADMVLNAAFLIAGHERDAFRQALDDTAGRHRDLLFHLSGPWAPYNFCPEVMAAHSTR